MSGVPSSRQRRSARAKVPAVRGWVTTSGGRGHAATFGHRGPGPEGRHGVARDDRVRKRERSSQHCEIVRVGFGEELRDDHSSRVGLAQFAQACLVRDAFSGWEVRDRIGAPEPLVDALGSEECGTDHGGTRPVGVRLGGHVPAFRLTPRHQGQDPVDVTSRRRVDVAVVHVRAGRTRGAHQLLGAVDERFRRELDDVPGVREGRDTSRRGQLRDCEILGRIDARRIADDDTDPDRARRDIVSQAGRGSVSAAGRRGLLPCLTHDPAENRRSRRRRARRLRPHACEPRPHDAEKPK